MNKRDVFVQAQAVFLGHHAFRAALLLACMLAPGFSWAKESRPPVPNWSLNPSDYQFNMNMIVRIRYNGTPNNAPGSMVGVFVGPELRGFASGVPIAGQMHYFITVYSNVYTGENLRFRTYFAPDDEIYAAPESLVFTHHKQVSSLENPFWVNLDPNTDFAPELLPLLADTTLQNIPFEPIELDAYLNSLDGDPVSWSAQAGPNLTATVLNGVLTVTPVSPLWLGTDTVRIIVTENTPGQLADTVVGRFTVLADYGPPIWLPIPSQSTFPQGAFIPFDLDNHLVFNGPCRVFDLDVFPYTGAVPDPAWPVVPNAPQSMTVVARPLFAGEQLAGPGAKLAAFVNNTLVGTAIPTGVSPNVSYTLNLQNLASGAITFRFYHAENQYLYEKSTALVFVPGGSAGSVAAPIDLQFSPLLPTLALDGTVQVDIVDSTWVGTFPVDFIVWDCDFPALRRDTTRALFSVVVDNRPHITSPPTVNFQENACYELYDAQATDPQDSEGNGLTYSIAGGADAAKFSINPANGKLSWFNFTPDFEMPGDANADNQYEVTIRVTNAMSLTDELALVVTVTDASPETFQPAVNGGATVVCLDGSAVLQATGGNAYQWSTGALTASINVALSGVYTVTISNAGGCSAILSTTVSKRPSVVATGGTAPVCAGSNIGLEATAIGGSGVYASFAWAGPNGFASGMEDPTPFPAMPLAAGTYTVTVTDNAGCSASATVTIAVSGNMAPSVVATANGPLCEGDNLLLNAVPAGGTGTYSQFKWSGPNTYASSSQGPSGFPVPLAASGTYTVTVTDNAGCTATGTATLLVKPRPTMTAGSNTPLCVDKLLSLNATPSGGSGNYQSFQWAGPNNYTALVEDPAAFPATLNASGTYTVMVTDNAGCSATATTSVAVSGLPSVTASLLGPVCTNGTVALGANPTGGTGTYTQFEWAGPNAYSATGQNPTPFAVIPAIAGIYTVTVTDQAGCSASGSVTVDIHPLPSIAASGNAALCEGSLLTLTSTPSGGTTPYTIFQWTGPDAYSAWVEDPLSFTTTLASTGTYQVKVTDSRGCSATATVPVTVNPKPNISASSNTPVCSSGNIDLQSSPTGGSGVYATFAWTGPNGYTAAQEDPPGFPANLTLSGTYRVTVTDNAGCTAAAATNVAVSAFAAPMVSATGNSPVCGGQNITLGANATGGSGIFSNFQWNGPNGYTAAVKNPPALVATAAATGVYTVKVTDSRGCAGTSTVNILVNAPTANPTFNAPICIGSTVLLSAVPSRSPAGYASFAWSGPNNYMGSGENPAGFTAGPNTVGTYTVTVTDNANCTGTGSVNVTLNANNPPSITCPPNQNLAAGANCTALLGDWRSQATNVMDDCTAPGNILVTQMPDAGTQLSVLGQETTVTLTADDGTGNTTPCTFKVTLKDQTAPTITCPTDQALTASATCTGTLGNWIGAATGVSDNCTASVTVSQLPIAATVLSGHDDFETVTLTADDGHGNTTPCTFKVALKDNTPPTIVCPADQTLAADNNCSGQLANYVGLATDLSDNCTAVNVITINQLPLVGTVLTGHNDVETVTLTADDGHGNTTPCTFKVTLKDITPPTITCPANKHRVPPTSTAPCFAVVTGIDAVYGDNCTATLTYTLSNATVGSGNGQASGLIFQPGETTVTYTVADGAQLSASCSFTVRVRPCQITFSGRIIWKQDNATGVKDATVTLSGDQTATALSNVTGNYSLTVPDGENFMITPTKNLNKLNGITSADAFRIQLHLSSNPITDPWQLIAADVSLNNVITSLDANIIQLSLLNNPQALAQFAKSWRFVPTNYALTTPPWGFPEKITLTDVYTPTVANQDFYGLKVGDVAAPYANPANGGTGQPLVLNAQEQPLQAGDTLSVELTANALQNIGAFQFGLFFNPKRLKIIGMEALKALPLSDNNWSAVDAGKGILRFVWVGGRAHQLPPDAPLFRLRWVVLKSGGLLSDALHLDDEALPGLVCNGQMVESEVELRFHSTTAAPEVGKSPALQLFQNHPNPFVRHTSIAFVLPQACEARLRIVDAGGRVVATRTQYYPEGQHEEAFDLSAVSGILYYELTTPFGVVSKKMTKVN